MRVCHHKCMRCRFHWVVPRDHPRVPICANCGATQDDLEFLGETETPTAVNAESRRVVRAGMIDE